MRPEYERFVALVRGGQTILQAERALGISHTSAYNWARRAGITLPKAGRSQASRSIAPVPADVMRERMLGVADEWRGSIDDLVASGLDPKLVMDGLLAAGLALLAVIEPDSVA